MMTESTGWLNKMCSLVKPSISAALPRFRTEITLLTHSVSKRKSATGGKPQYVGLKVLYSIASDSAFSLLLHEKQLEK